MNEKQISAFTRLKDVMYQQPILIFITQSIKQRSMQTLQVIDMALRKSKDNNCLHPIYSMSRKTTDYEKRYSSYELEILVVIVTLKIF